MTAMALVKKYKEYLKKVVAALGLSLLMAAFILAFVNEWLPDVSEGDAFDTVYAVNQ